MKLGRVGYLGVSFFVAFLCWEKMHENWVL